MNQEEKPMECCLDFENDGPKVAPMSSDGPKYAIPVPHSEALCVQPKSFLTNFFAFLGNLGGVLEAETISWHNFGYLTLGSPPKLDPRYVKGPIWCVIPDNCACSLNHF